MAAAPAVPLSVLGLCLCLSVLRGLAADSTLPSPAAATHEAPRSHGHTAEPQTAGSTATNTDGSVTRGPHSSNGTTGVTERTTLSTSSRAETTGSSTRPRAEESTPGVSPSVWIPVILTVLVSLLILFLVILTRWTINRSRHRAGGVRGTLVAGVQAVQSRLGVRLWPGKSGGLGDGEEDEEKKEGGEEDVEQGKGRNAVSQEEKREEEEEDNSSDDNSSLEGYDLRDRARQREEEEEKGKRASQNQGKEEEEEEGKSGGATPAEKSEGGGMEECDLTAL